MSIEEIREKIIEIIKQYNITRIVMFGSRASGTYNENSDIDFIVEFGNSVSLIKLASLKYDLEDALGLPVDVIHGPIRDTDMIEVGDTVEIYAA
jgi:predicted nucleotidyltransferase